MKTPFYITAALLLFGLTASADDHGEEAKKEKQPPKPAPFSDRLEGKVHNYNRATPYIATSGQIEEGGLEQLKEHDFKTIIDLRTPLEGTAEEEKAAKELGFNYLNIPVAGAVPAEKDMEKFAEVVDNPDNYPILVHCRGGSRVGMVWSVYRNQKGVPEDLAVMEGLTIGMNPRLEAMVREEMEKRGSKKDPHVEGDAPAEESRDPRRSPEAEAAERDRGSRERDRERRSPEAEAAERDREPRDRE